MKTEIQLIDCGFKKLIFLADFSLVIKIDVFFALFMIDLSYMGMDCRFVIV